MAFDTHKNLSISSVTTAPSPPTSGTSLVVVAGEGVRFPAVPFNATIWPASAVPNPANAEIVRVTAKTGDALTVTRAQEGTTARAVGFGDQIAATVTVKTLTDLETQAALLDAPNVFTREQMIKGANPQVSLWDTTAPVDARWFDLVNTLASQQLKVRAINDAGTVATSTPLTLTRTGDAKIERDIYEKGRATPMGHWIGVPFNAANFSAAQGGTLTVTAQDLYEYMLIGKTCFLHLTLAASGATISGAPVRIYIQLPPGITSVNALTGTPFNFMAGTTAGVGLCIASWGQLDCLRDVVGTTYQAGGIYLHLNINFAIP